MKKITSLISDFIKIIRKFYIFIMHFKQWMKLLETIAPDVKEIILKAKWPASKEEVDKKLIL